MSIILEEPSIDNFTGWGGGGGIGDGELKTELIAITNPRVKQIKLAIRNSFLWRLSRLTSEPIVPTIEKNKKTKPINTNILGIFASLNKRKISKIQFTILIKILSPTTQQDEKKRQA
jgi:hypothetical protein